MKHIAVVLTATYWKLGQRLKLTDNVGADCPLPYLAMHETHGDDSEEIILTLNWTRVLREISITIAS